MCLQDIAIGRIAVSSTNTVLANGSDDQLLCAPNKNRIRLIIWVQRASLIYIAPEGISVNANTGFELREINQPLVIRIEDWGDCVTKAWKMAGGGAVNVSFTEVSLSKEAKL